MSSDDGGSDGGGEMDDFDAQGQAHPDEHDVSQMDADMGGPVGGGDNDSFVEAMVLGPQKANVTTPNTGFVTGLLPSFMQPSTPVTQVSRVDPSWDAAHAAGRGLMAAAGLVTGGLPGLVGAGKMAYDAATQNIPAGATYPGGPADTPTDPFGGGDDGGYDLAEYQRRVPGLLSGQDALDLATPAVTPVSAPEYQYLENWWDGNVFHPAPITRRI